jgi:murein DD-endopeptidase MepM/ murein hydrolase activator NlpD
MKNAIIVPIMAVVLYFLWKWAAAAKAKSLVVKYQPSQSSPNPYESPTVETQPKIVAPVTPLSIRGCDGLGCGGFGVSRASGTRTHKGLDFVITPGQTVVSPINGTIKRNVDVYSDGKWKGLYISGEDFDIKIFYLNYNPSIIGKTVQVGEAIATAANIADKYPGITPHIHLETWVYGSAVDPTPFFEGLV